jgi:MFS family permease
LLGGVLVDALSWRWIFGVNILPLAVTLYLTTRLSPAEFRSERRTKIDFVGAVLTAVGLTGAVYALIEQQRFGMANPVVLTSLLVGVACLAAFPWWESRAANPMMPLHIFAARNFAVGNVATVFLYAAVSRGILLVALFLQETAGMSATEAGVATLPIPVLSFFLARRFGALAGRHGPRLYMALGPLIAAAGFLSMTTGANAARARGLRFRAHDDGFTADGGGAGRGRSGTERHRLGHQQRDRPHRRLDRCRADGCDHRRHS